MNEQSDAAVAAAIKKVARRMASTPRVDAYGIVNPQLNNVSQSINNGMYETNMIRTVQRSHEKIRFFMITIRESDAAISATAHAIYWGLLEDLSIRHHEYVDNGYIRMYERSMNRLDDR